MEETPDITVAAKIIAELKEKKLLNDKQLEGLAKSLPTGAIKSEIWKGILEIATAKKESKNAQD
jgi:hypothetical protein